MSGVNGRGPSPELLESISRVPGIRGNTHGQGLILGESLSPGEITGRRMAHEGYREGQRSLPVALGRFASDLGLTIQPAPILYRLEQNQPEHQEKITPKHREEFGYDDVVSDDLIRAAKLEALKVQSEWGAYSADLQERICVAVLNTVACYYARNEYQTAVAAKRGEILQLPPYIWSEIVASLKLVADEYIMAKDMEIHEIATIEASVKAVFEVACQYYQRFSHKGSNGRIIPRERLPVDPRDSE